MNSISVPIVHPAFQKLKKSGTILHFTAALFILAHAISHINLQSSEPLYFWCLLILAIDIFILVIAGRNILQQLPKVNLFFRLVEIVFFICIGITMLMRGQLPAGILHILLSLAYGYLFYCERKLSNGERLGIHHTGITVPGIPENHFFIWSKINAIHPRYDSIRIETSEKKKFDFRLSRNLNFDELEQIHSFCKHYLGAEIR